MIRDWDYEAGKFRNHPIRPAVPRGDEDPCPEDPFPFIVEDMRDTVDAVDRWLRGLTCDGKEQGSYD